MEFKIPYLSISISIIILGLSFFVAKLVNWLWFKPKKLQKFLIKHGFQGNRYRPPLGDLLDLVSMAKQAQPRAIKLSDDPMAHALPYVNYLQKKYGENTFVWLGPSPTLLVSDPQRLKEILAKPNIFQKPHPDPIVEPIIGGLLYLEGEKWMKHRKIVNPTFHIEKLKTMVSTICLSCSSMLDKWESLLSSTDEYQEIDVLSDIENLTGDVISRTAFGSSHAKGKRIFKLQKELVRLVLDIMIILIPGWRYVPTKANRRMDAILKEMHTSLRGMIKQREKALEAGEIIEQDLLGTLMESNMNEIREHGSTMIQAGLSIEDVIEECKLFYFAGSETTTSVLVWTVVMLSIHQEWQTRAREEVLQLFGTKNEPTFEGLNRLKMVTMILHEVMRLYTPVPAMNRATTEAVKLGDITLPKGLKMILIPGLLHRDPKIWGDDVNEFKPERFSEGVSGASKIPFSFIPFSSGPRVCMGQHFAMIEAKLALVMILRRFSFELSKTYLHAPFLIISLQPQYGVPLLLRKLP